MAKKIASIIIIITLVLLLGSEWMNYTSTQNIMKTSLEKRIKTIALTAAHLTSEAMAMNYLSFLQEEVVKIKASNPDILEVSIVGVQQDIMAHNDETLILSKSKSELENRFTMEWRGNAIMVKAPITVGHKLEGNLVFSVDGRQLERAKKQFLIASVIKSAFVLLVGMLLSLLISSRIAKPLKILSEYARGLPRKDFSSEQDITASTMDTVVVRNYFLPFKAQDEVKLLADSFMFMKDELKANVRSLMEASAARERIESELNVAREIQQGLLPKIFPPFPNVKEFDLHALLIPAKEVGGDLYDFFFIDDDHLCFAIGDVSDKGVPAALFMAITMTLIKNSVQRSTSPAAMLSEINSSLSSDNPRCMFVTLIIGILNITTGQVRYANGGHNPPLLVSSDGTGSRFIKGLSGPLIGIRQDIPYEELGFNLKRGDTLFLYTDGVTESMNIQKEPFSNERLLAEAAAFSNNSVARVISNTMTQIHSHVGTAPQSDDITMLVLRYNGNGQSDA
ncbi:MAG: PP2C family protein-serine/threonine phosphatase [bacterium]|nr:PP2C family protein-serine/threonine phosphatase [bacterium]